MYIRHFGKKNEIAGIVWNSTFWVMASRDNPNLVEFAVNAVKHGEWFWMRLSQYSQLLAAQMILTCIGFTLGFWILIIVLVFTVIGSGMGLYRAIWSDCYKSLHPWHKTPHKVNILSRNDQGPFPGTHRSQIGYDPMMNCHYDMTTALVYRHHLKRYFYKNKRPLDDCSYCIESFTMDDLYGKPSVDPGNNYQAPNVYITQCGHLLHRDCLWEYCTETQTNYFYNQNVPCPMCTQRVKFDYFTRLYDPDYIWNNFYSIYCNVKGEEANAFMSQLETQIGNFINNCKQFLR